MERGRGETKTGNSWRRKKSGVEKDDVKEQELWLTRLLEDRHRTEAS